MTELRERPIEQVHVFPLARQLSDALEGAVYPLTLNELVTVARENEAPRTLLSLLHRMPERSYGSLADAQEQMEAAFAQTSP